jgi:sulfonate transport system substrate-binding protein
MKTISRRLFNLLLGSVVAGTLLASPQAYAQDDVDLSKVVLRIGDQVGGTRAKLEAAGLLDDVPYEIEWSVYPAAVNLHEALKADAIDVGQADISPTVSAIAGGSRIKAVANFTNGGRGSSIILPAGSPIKTIQDLKGKTISPTTRGSVAHYLTIGVLKDAGLTADDVTLSFLTPVDASAAFQSGNIDAWATWSIYKTRSIGQLGATVLVDGPGYIPGYFVLSATDTALQDSGKVAAIADYADRIERGYQWSKANKEAFIDFFSGFSRQDREVVEDLYPDEEAFARKLIDDEFVETAQTVYDTWVSEGVLSEGLDLSEYAYRDLPTSN